MLIDGAVIKWSSVTMDDYKHIKCVSVTMDDHEHIKDRSNSTNLASNE